MGVSLAEVEVATRIRQKYLSAIEADDWHLLPGEVVGRGFLRNFSEYLGLEPHEVVDRRRAVTDPGLAAALSTTSSGAQLPPERQVDYRPKEVELKDEVDGIQRGEIRLTPVLSIVALAALVALVWWGATRLRDPIAGAYESIQTQWARVAARDVPTATPMLIGIVNTENVEPDDGPSDPGESLDAGGAPPAEGGGGSGDISESGPVAAVVLEPTVTPTALPPTATPTPEPPTSTPEPPTPEPTPTFTFVPPTPTPEIPTDTPEPAPPPIVAAACPDGRSVIVSPGVNQVVSGVLTVSGTAIHDALDYYKLEFAPGANAADGFVYFDGRKSPISNGALGSIDTRNLPNGSYTLRVTAVDQTGNFPPPCDVTFVVQN